MKILSAKISIKGICEDFEINFLDKDGPTIHYLVGNNGVGKTLLLNALYGATSLKMDSQYSVDNKLRINRRELPDPPANEDSFVFNTSTRHKKKNSIDIVCCEGLESLNLSREEFSKLRKAVLSSAEVNFSSTEVKNISTSSVDSENPNDISRNLGKTIPQLLVDIKHQDDQANSEFLQNSVGKNISVPSLIDLPGNKLKRFIDSYDAIFDGDKIFKEISRTNKGYEINFLDNKDNLVGLDSLSTGEKQVIYRLGFILKDLESIKDGVILIDEPELSLHPIWQVKFKEFLLKIFEGDNIQIIIATHSPYIYGDINPNKEECIKINVFKDIST